jgi:putative transposase
LSLQHNINAWCARPVSARAQADAALLDQICAIHTRSRGTYGVSRVHAELAAQGIHIGASASSG